MRETIVVEGCGAKSFQALPFFFTYDARQIGKDLSFFFPPKSFM